MWVFLFYSWGTAVIFWSTIYVLPDPIISSPSPMATSAFPRPRLLCKYRRRMCSNLVPFTDTVTQVFVLESERYVLQFNALPTSSGPRIWFDVGLSPGSPSCNDRGILGDYKRDLFRCTSLIWDAERMFHDSVFALYLTHSENPQDH